MATLFGTQAKRLGKENVSQTIPESASGLNSLHQPIARELVKVEKLLLAELRQDVPWMNELLASSTLSQGKRMRPTMLLLAAGHFGPFTHRHLSIAAAIDMIHLATLVHDDVLDGADSRRHKDTVNKRFGQKVSILLGDYLFTHAFYVGSKSQSIEGISILSSASNRVCEGEMKQNLTQGDLGLTQADYLSIISDKTAELCAAACHLGAILSGANEHLCAGFETFGRDLGIAFQIIDDVLDICGDPKSVGKTLGTDAANLKMTLPLIHCRNSLNDELQSQFLAGLATKNMSHEALVRWLKRTGSIEFSKNLAYEKIGRAIAFAKSLESTEYSRALLQMAEFVLKRSH